MRITLNGIVASDEDVWVYDFFGYKAFSPQTIRDAIAQNPADEELVLELNSPGGSVFAGAEIYTLLKNTSVTTRAEIQSLAASAASYLCLGCDSVEISPVAQMMIHLPTTVTAGDKTAHQRSIQMLDTTRESILNAYELKVKGKTQRAELRRMMSAETWLTAQDALDKGLVDGILFTEQESTISPANVMNAFGLPDLAALRKAYMKAQEQPQTEQEPDWQLQARLELEKNRF